MKKTILVAIVFLLAQNFLFAQIKVSGKVTDAKSKTALVGATVRIGNSAATSDENGVFQIEMPKSGSYDANVTFIGYQNLTQKVQITEGSPSLDFALSEGNILMQTTTVTAGKFDKPLAEVTVSMEVLKPKLIENTNTRQVTDVLQKVPGVNIIDGQANIRGGSGWSYGAGSRVLLLVDDIPAMQADAGFPNWRDQAVENIEQIEVVKGAASALYGSSAMNGIINIRTGFAKSEPETQLSTYYTAYLPPKDPVKDWWTKAKILPYEAGASFVHKQKFDKLDFAGSLNYFNSNSFNQNSFDKVGRVTVNTRYRVTDRLSIGLNANFNTGASQSFFYFGDDKDSAYIGSPSSVALSNKTRYWIDPYLNYFDKSGNRHKILTRFYKVSNDNSGNQSNTSELYYGEYQFQRQFTDGFVVTAGAVVGGTHTSANLYGNADYTSSNFAAYAQIDKKINRLNLSFGVRYEKNTINGTDSVTYTPKLKEAVRDGGKVSDAKPVLRIGANYQIGRGTFIRGSWGQGYRFPTIAEMFINTTSGALRIYPSPQLQSETGWTGELGVKQGFQIGNFQAFVDAAAFWSEYQNMMEFQFSEKLLVAAGAFGFQSVNIGDTKITGLELSIAGQGRVGNANASILMGYTYIEPVFKNFTDLEKGQGTAGYNVLKYRFKHNFKFDGELEFKHFSVGLAVLANSKLESVDKVLDFIKGIQSYRLSHPDGFSTVDVRGAYRFSPKIKLSIIGANILNEEYTYRPGIVEAPRNIQARVDWKF